VLDSTLSIFTVRHHASAVTYIMLSSCPSVRLSFIYTA